MFEYHYSSRCKFLRKQIIQFLQINLRVIGLTLFLASILFTVNKLFALIVLIILVVSQAIAYKTLCFYLNRVPLLYKWDEKSCVISTIKEDIEFSRDSYFKIIKLSESMEAFKISKTEIVSERLEKGEKVYSLQEMSGTSQRNISNLLENVVFSKEISLKKDK